MARLGPDGVARKITDAIGTEKPVFLSVDIDVLDPGLAPGKRRYCVGETRHSRS